jgi:hypothetical protein
MTDTGYPYKDHHCHKPTSGVYLLMQKKGKKRRSTWACSNDCGRTLSKMMRAGPLQKLKEKNHSKRTDSLDPDRPK